MVMWKMFSGVLPLFTAWATQLNWAAMSLSQLTVSSVWCWTMDRISSYCSLETSSSWETSSSSTCSSRTVGHSGSRKKICQMICVKTSAQVVIGVRVVVLHLWAGRPGRSHTGSVAANTLRSACEGLYTTSCSAGNGGKFPSLHQKESDVFCLFSLKNRN